MIAKVEAEHEKRYRKLLANVEEGKVFEKDEAIFWQCRNCGFVFEGKKVRLIVRHALIRKLTLNR